jgi:CheY-like chemotaxis protein
MPPSILVVDDDELVSMSLQLALGMEGYTVQTAHSGSSALQLVSESRPDLIILDIAMPGMDGWDALKKLRELSTEYQLPVVALTGNEPEPSEFREAGFTGCLWKGSSLDRFLCTIRRVMEVAARTPGAWVDSCTGERCAEHRGGHQAGDRLSLKKPA